MQFFETKTLSLLIKIIKHTIILYQLFLLQIAFGNDVFIRDSYNNLIVNDNNIQTDQFSHLLKVDAFNELDRKVKTITINNSEIDYIGIIPLNEVISQLDELTTVNFRDIFVL